MRTEQLGELRVRLTGGQDGMGGGDGPVVILLHGFGAPGDDLVPLAGELGVSRKVRFLFPEGPLSFDMGFGESRAWWMIDLERLQHAVASGQLRDLSREVPVGIESAREEIIRLLDHVEHRLGVPGTRIVVGGFSQGAMLACDVALRTQRTLAGLVLLSATLVAEDEWALRATQRRGLRVLQTHGRFDPLLPFPSAERLRDLLRSSGLTVEWVEFEGGHELPRAVLARLGEFIRNSFAP